MKDKRHTQSFNERQENLNNAKTQALNIPVVMGSFLLMLFNVGGTAVWINLYTSGRIAEWWVFALITWCGWAALIFALKFAKAICRGLYT